MKNLSRAALLGASLVVGASTVAFAQTAEPPALVPIAPIPAAPKEARAVKIVNVPSAFIAYWLDPAHNLQPPMFVNERMAKIAAGDMGKGVFVLPDGVESIVSVDAQNVVLITGTARAIGQVEDLIAVLDQPLRQVEIEAQFVELTAVDLRAFGIDFSTSRASIDTATPGVASAPVQGAFQVGFVRNNFTARLNALVADGKAKIITAPRVTAINNLTATITSTGKETVDGKSVDVTNSYRITPTINGDDTITVLFKITENENNEAGKSGRSTIVNVRDGDTIALLNMVDAQFRTGDQIAVMDANNLRPTDPERVVVVFLTARIIRRAGEMPKK